MYNLNDNELYEYINEDIPYLDLTTHLQDINGKKAKMEIFTREDIIVSCSEESARIAELLGCEVEFFIPSRKKLARGETIISFSGDYNDVHKAWRSCQVILEYSCKIATYTNSMKERIESANNHCELLTTRKSFPFAKKFCIKSVLAGGAFPHRLNLGETILFFEQHRIVYDTPKDFYEFLEKVKKKTPEKKIVVETNEIGDAKNLMRYGADVLQIDKADINTLKEIINYKNENYKGIKIIAAGGINLENCAQFAQTGVDGIVTSRVYFCGMANLGTKLTRL